MGNNKTGEIVRKDGIKGDTGTAKVVNYGICTYDLSGTEGNPLAINITSGLEIALGMNIDIYIKELRYTDLRVRIQKECDDKYIVIRESAGIGHEREIATLKCRNKKIQEIEFNKELMFDEEYKRYIGISILGNFNIRRTSDYRSSIAKAITIIGYGNDNIVIDVQENGNVTANVNGRNYKVEFKFRISGDKKRYILHSIYGGR